MAPKCRFSHGVFASEFTSPANWTLWTVVNRAGVDVGGGGGDPEEAPAAAAAALELPCREDSRFFDIWMGAAETHTSFLHHVHI